jgi:hypothetical protein
MNCYRNVDPGYEGYSSEIISQLYKNFEKPKKSSKEKYMVYKILEGYYSLLCEYEMLKKEVSLYLDVYFKNRNLRREITSKEQIPSIMYNTMSRIIKVHKALEELESSQFIQVLIKESSNGLKIRMDFLTPEEDVLYQRVLWLYEESEPFPCNVEGMGNIKMGLLKFACAIGSIAIVFGIFIFICFLISLF